MPIADDDFNEMMGGGSQSLPQAAAPVARPQGTVGDRDFGEMLNPPAPAQSPRAVESTSPFSLVPATRYEPGGWQFDSNAGMLGAGKRALGAVYNGVTWPGRVMTGQSPPPPSGSGADPSSTEDPVRAAEYSFDAVAPFAGGDLAGSAPGVGALGRAARPGDIPAPTIPELVSTAKGQYDAADALGVMYHPDAIGAMADEAKYYLNNKNFIPPNAPATHALLSKLSDPGNVAPVRLSDLDSARQRFGDIAYGKGYSNQDQAAAGITIGKIDDFISSAGAPDIKGPGERFDQNPVLAGPAAAAGDLYDQARGNIAASKRSELLQNTATEAGQRTNSIYSGRNFDNTLRQKFRPLLSPNSSALDAFTPEERAAVDNINTGSTPRNVLRTVSNMTGGKLGMPATIAGTAALVSANEAGVPGAMWAAAVPAAGTVANAGANALANRSFKAADELVRQRSPLFQERLKGATAYPYAAPYSNTLRASALQADNPEQSQQQAYARGGSVKPKMTHEQLVDRLMKMVEKAKRAEKKRTKPILNVPDNAVAAALKKAQAAI